MEEDPSNKSADDLFYLPPTEISHFLDISSMNGSSMNGSSMNEIVPHKHTLHNENYIHNKIHHNSTHHNNMGPGQCLDKSRKSIAICVFLAFF